MSVRTGCVITIVLAGIAVGIALGHGIISAGELFQPKRQVNAAFLHEARTPLVMLFFGYPGCGDLCPRALASLAQLKKRRAAAAEAPVDVLFINLSTVLEGEAATAYAHAFHPDFIAIHPTSVQMRAWRRTFRLNHYPSPNQLDIIHRGLIYLVRREADQWWLRRIYTAPDVERWQRDIQRLGVE